MNVFNLGFLRIAVALTVMMAASIATASDSTVAERVNQNWDDSALTLSLPGGSGDVLHLGEFYQVLVTAKSEGYLYLVQQNSQERSSGKMRLVLVSQKVPGYRGGNAFMYPAVESLVAVPPLGLASVQAIFTNQPLPLDTPNTSVEAGKEFPMSEEALLTLIDDARKADPDFHIAFQSVTYDVALADGELEHTTRSIARQINTAITSADLEPDNDGVLTSFDAHIQFEFGSAVPTFNGQLQLDAFGDVLTRPEFKDIQFVVAGHTDDIGEEDFNLNLSDARAKAVSTYLQQHYGIPTTRMIVEAFGEDSPYVENTDDSSRALNRRVEFTLLRQP